MDSVSNPGRKAVSGVARRGAGVRGVAGAAATVAAVAGSLALAGPAWASGAQAGARQAAAHQAAAHQAAAHQAVAAPAYTFSTLDNPADPTFNQLLGINSHNVIAGYFGSGAAGHPNKGYLLTPPYGQAGYVNENFPGSAQTQVTGLNNKGDTAGFWVNAKGTNRGFVEWNGVFASYTNPKTPHTAGAVNQLLGINNAGIAAGFYTDAQGHSHAYELNQATSQFTAIHIPGAVSATATAINNLGDVTGFATDAAGTTSGWLLRSGQLIAFQFPGGTGTQAFGVNDKDQIVGSYLDGAGVQHGFVLTSPLGPVSHWKTIDDPNGVGSTLVNGINNAGDLVGFYTDAAGNTHGMLATRATTVVKTVTLAGMPSATATFGRDGSGNLTVQLNVFGLTPGSSHALDLQGPGGSGTLARFSMLTADGTGQADATLSSTYTGSIPDGSVLVLRNGSQSGRLFAEPIAETAPLSGVVNGSPISLTATAIGRSGTNYGTPQGQATITYDPAAQTLTVKVSASGLIPGLHAAHIHLGSCMSQGPVQYMLMDLAASPQGKITNATRVITGVTSPPPPSGWYLNIHQGNSNVIVKNGQPTIFFRPMLCSDI